MSIEFLHETDEFKGFKFNIYKENDVNKISLMLGEDYPVFKLTFGDIDAGAMMYLSDEESRKIINEIVSIYGYTNKFLEFNTQKEMNEYYSEI